MGGWTYLTGHVRPVPRFRRGTFGRDFSRIGMIAASMSGMIGAVAAPAWGTPSDPTVTQIGRSAPDFTASDRKGRSIHLSQYHGKTVVLEWTNADCPYTRKHYSSGNMQSVQALAQKTGVVWLTIIFSAPGGATEPRPEYRRTSLPTLSVRCRAPKRRPN
jgi:AhpC/TSA family